MTEGKSAAGDSGYRGGDRPPAFQPCPGPMSEPSASQYITEGIPAIIRLRMKLWSESRLFRHIRRMSAMLCCIWLGVEIGCSIIILPMLWLSGDTLCASDTSLCSIKDWIPLVYVLNMIVKGLAAGGVTYILLDRGESK